MEDREAQEEQATLVELDEAVEAALVALAGPADGVATGAMGQVPSRLGALWMLRWARADASRYRWDSAVHGEALPETLRREGERLWESLGGIEAALRAALAADLRYLVSMRTEIEQVIGSYRRSLQPFRDLDAGARRSWLGRLGEIATAVRDELAGRLRAMERRSVADPTLEALARFMTSLRSLIDEAPSPPEGESGGGDARWRIWADMAWRNERAYRVLSLAPDLVQWRRNWVKAHGEVGGSFVAQVSRLRALLLDGLQGVEGAAQREEALAALDQSMREQGQRIEGMLGELIGRYGETLSTLRRIMDQVAASPLRAFECRGVKGAGHLMRRVAGSRLRDAWWRLWWWMGKHGALWRRLRLRLHPDLQQHLLAYEEQSAQHLEELRRGIRRDAEQHAEIFAPLERTIEVARQRIGDAYARHASSAPMSQRLAVKEGVQRALKQVYTTLDRVVAVRLERYYGADPLTGVLQGTLQSGHALSGCFPRGVEVWWGSPPLGWRRRVARFNPLERRRVWVRFRGVMRQWQMAREPRDLALLPQKLVEHRQRTLRKLREVWNIVRYNLEGALAEVEESLRVGEEVGAAWEKSRESADGGLQRALFRIGELMESLQDLHRQLDETCGRWLGYSRSLAESVAATATLRGSARFGWRVSALWLLRRWLHLRTLGKRGQRALTRWLQQGLQEGWTRSRRLRSAVGILEAPQLLQTVERADFSCDDTKALGLPPVYLRLFSLEPLVLDEFLVGREEAMAAFREAFVAWREGKRSALLVYGESGSGKRSLLNCALDANGEGAEIARTQVTQTRSTEEELVLLLAQTLGHEGAFADLEALITWLQGRSRQLIVVENVHRLYLRRIGGFGAIQALMHVVSRTPQHLWVVSLEAHPHAFLQRLFRLNDAFTHIVATQSLSDMELQRAVLVRHDLSGFKLHFEPDPSASVKVSKALQRARGEHAKQRVISAYFFRQLRSHSGGNLLSALSLWLESTHVDASGKAVVVRPLAAPETEVLRRLTQQHCFALAALLQHGDLNAIELAQVLTMALGPARLTLQLLHQRQVLELRSAQSSRDPDVQRYKIASRHLGGVIKHLQGKHIVYWSAP